MKVKTLLTVALLLVCSLAHAQMQLPPIPVDKDVRIGKLDNGLTYYIRYNNWPEHRANFYIAQKVGSIQEEESQRGLAHFLEHMAFNGSDNFKGNSLIEYLRSIGVAFGADLNAYTSIDQTVYNIDNVPTTRQSALDSCLLILRDWADGLTLDPEEIDKERGVIHEEWRLRTSANSRMLERNLPALYPNSKYGVRYPIGLMSVVDNFKYQELRDYYEKWYHPTNQGIIVVGDVDVDHTEAMIKKLFGPITNPDNAAPIVDEPVPDNDEPIVIIDKDKEQTSSAINIFFKHDVFPTQMKNSAAYLMYNFVVNAATNMLNQRLDEVKLKADCPFTSAYTYDGSYIYSKTKDAFTIGVEPKDMSKIADCVQAVLVEVRRAAEYGFTATEYDRFKQNYLSRLEQSYANKDKRTNSQLYREILGHFLEQDPLPSIDYSYQTMKQLVPAVPLEAVNQTIKEFIPADNKNMVILNFNNEKDGNVYPTKEGLLSAVAAARAADIQPFVDNTKNEPLISKLPKAGKVKSEKQVPALGYTELTLSNGVKVLLKQTDYKKDQVLMSGEGPGGSSLYSGTDLTNTDLFDEAIGVSGLGNFSSTELQKVLAGKIANANLSMSERHMNISGNASPKDVETMLQMTYLYFTNINKDQQSYDNMIQQYQVALKNRELNPDIALSDSLTATLYGHDPRMKPLTLDRLGEANYDRILAMAKELTKSAAGWTFIIVGNYDEKTIRPLICQYLGALPTKGKVADGKRLSKMVEGTVENIFQRKQETPKSTAYMIWDNTKMAYTQQNITNASLAGQLLSMIYLKKIREEASAAYSCGAQGSMNPAEDYNSITLLAYCPMKPEMKDVALKIMSEEVPNLANNVDAEMLQKCKETSVKNYNDALKNNRTWMSAIKNYDKYGIDQLNGRDEVIKSQTPETIKAFMKEFLQNSNKVTVAMLPAE